MKPEFIFFDVGNTLLFPDRATILRPLLERNVAPTLERWHAIERRTKREFDAAMSHPGTVDQGFWFRFYTHLLEELGIADDALHAQLVEATRTSANWCAILPGTRRSLEQIAGSYKIAVISNADGKIDQVLSRCDIADCFLTITDSGIVGHEKPHPAVFEAALRATNAEARRSLYVGDVYSVDYVGATQAGMQAVLFDRCGAYKDLPVPRVESLEQLTEWLAT